MACYSASCPDIAVSDPTLWSDAYEIPATGTDGKPKPAEQTQAEKDKAAAIKAIQDLKGDAPPTTPSQKCALYCQEIQRAEALRCQKLRDKVMYALEKAGCPSNVTPRATGSSGCAPCQQYSSYGAYMPSYTTTTGSSSNSSAMATAGSCSSGSCPLTR